MTPQVRLTITRLTVKTIVTITKERNLVLFEDSPTNHHWRGLE